MLEIGIGGQPRLAANARINFALQPVLVIEPSLELPHAATAIRFGQAPASDWLRSTTPFSCGRQGVFQNISISKPISHSASDVGRSLHEPHGAPSSTHRPYAGKQSPQVPLDLLDRYLHDAS